MRREEPALRARVFVNCATDARALLCSTWTLRQRRGASKRFNEKRRAMMTRRFFVATSGLSLKSGP
jgi:hypothetical protein